MGRAATINAPQQFSELSGSALMQVALQTLARFNFKVLYTHLHLFFLVFLVLMSLDNDQRL